MKKIVFIAIAITAWYQFFYTPSIAPIGAGIVSGGLPYIDEPDKAAFRIGDYSYTPVKKMQVDGRVLAVSQRYLDRMSRISSADIVIGWQELSDEATLKNIDFSIYDRSYEWDNRSQELDNDFIKQNTKLLHVVPANDEIKTQLRDIKIGQVLFASGYTVNVKSASGLSWRTLNKNQRPSRSGIAKKTTEGDLFYIESMEIIDPLLRL